MSEAKGHPGKLRGRYRRNCKIAVALTLVIALSALLVRQNEQGWSVVLLSPFWLYQMYLGLRVGSAYDWLRGSVDSDRRDAWTWPLLTILFILGHAISNQETTSIPIDDQSNILLYLICLALLLVSIPMLIHAFWNAGWKLAWLAGDEIGGRSTFLRFLQLAYWPFTFNYINLHTRDPKRPIIDHP